MKKINFLSNPEDWQKRLDITVAKYTNFSRNKIQHAIKKNKVKIEQKIINKCGFILPAKVVLVEIEMEEEKQFKIIAQKIPLEIIFENQDVIVLNKKMGIITHPSITNDKNTLINALIGHNKKLSNLGLPYRPGVVHRLDKETSGVIILAKNDQSHIFLAQQFAKRKVKKEYLALVHGKLKYQKGTINSPITRSNIDRKKMTIAMGNKKGKEAITHFEKIENFAETTLVKINLETGRTHQIRVHFASLGHPLVGDTKYGCLKADKFLEKKLLIKIPSLMLHAEKLEIFLPKEKEKSVFKVPLQEDFFNFLKS